MKINLDQLSRAFVAGLFTGLFFMVFLPYWAVRINTALGWPRLINRYSQLGGGALLFFGAAVFVYSFVVFIKQGEGTPAPMEPAQKLITKGLFAYLRNPMYVGYLAFLTGELFIWGYPFQLIYLAFIWVFLRWYVVKIEEPALFKRFGQDYIEYCKKTPRWF